MTKTLALAVLCSLASTSAWSANAVRDLSMEGDRVTIGLSGQAEYTTMNMGTKIVVDIKDTNLAGPAKTVNGSGGKITKIRAGQFKDAPEPTTRIVIELNEGGASNIQRSGDNLIVDLNPSAQRPVIPAASAAVVKASAPSFEVGADEVKVRVSGAAAYKAKFADNPTRLEIDVAGAAPGDQARMEGKGKVLKGVSSRKAGANTIVSLELKKKVSYSIEKKDGMLMVDLNP